MIKKTKLKAIELLARREHSKLELQRKLVAKGFTHDLAEETVQLLAKQGLQSDERFAEAYIRHRSQKGFGPLRIEMELLEKGLTTEFIFLFLKKNDPLWITKAEETKVKKFGPKKAENFKEYAKQSNFLQYKGFTKEQIKRVTNEHDNE